MGALAARLGSASLRWCKARLGWAQLTGGHVRALQAPPLDLLGVLLAGRWCPASCQYMMSIVYNFEGWADGPTCLGADA